MQVAHVQQLQGSNLRRLSQADNLRLPEDAPPSVLVYYVGKDPSAG